MYNGIYHDADGRDYHFLKWDKNNDVCPKCKSKCETLEGKGDDGHLYNLAERCPSGCYAIHFDEI